MNGITLVPLDAALAAERAAATGRLDEPLPHVFGLAALRGGRLVGWTEGHRLGSKQFHMRESGVAVRSLHVASNSPVLIAKLRLGFFVAGFEYSEVYGPLVQLRYLVGEPRRALYRARTVSIRPPDTDLAFTGAPPWPT